MPAVNFTKRAFAEAIKELVIKTPFEKITVKNIVSYCDVNRNTFYYHFADKYDLMVWIFQQEIQNGIENFYDPPFIGDTFNTICHGLYEKDRAFWFNCLQYFGQNSFYDYLNSEFIKILKEYVVAFYADLDITIPENTILIMAKMGAASYSGLIRDWVLNGMKESFLYDSKLICDFFNWRNTDYVIVKKDSIN